ncbi:malate synthase G [Palleronia caenipelagi]|uniref:Malate synthase G n=1 Tax=Palleronia caenipelagi TaxID=2489174 RepID=A0A547Q925_9RHOB|nr:malate synthase G [Palleronia caenipelagi]TRD22889.1 malate synthase G [Palleronia caenipelagi]
MTISTDHSNRIQSHDLNIDPTLKRFVDDSVLPGLNIPEERFWAALSDILHRFAPRNRELLARRAEIQTQIDDWHKTHRDKPHDSKLYKSFLEEIGYLVPEGDDFSIETANTDPEIASVPGPQLVVPSTNARFVLNAANARWGSLYDSLYGTDAMGPLPPAGGFDDGRGSRVVARAAVFLDEIFPLEAVSHVRASTYTIVDGQLQVDGAPLKNPAAFAGYTGAADQPNSVLLRNNGLHVELVFDASHPIGTTSPSGLADVVLESAMSAIIDMEDSVACVDGADKALAYRNWLGLMKGDLEETFTKGGREMTRRLHGDRCYTAPDGSELVLKGRALLLVRNVGHLMTNPAILDRDGNEVFEGLMDAVITTLIAMHDLNKANGPRNSVTGSVYVVKPKMHGPEEVAFANEVFSAVEDALGLPAYTVKLGIMDEERRTSANLKECIRAAKHRVCFINTGFLDRTGDEIHTSMEAGPFSRKDFIKRKDWIGAYENRNVDIGLECGLSGKAQIGKGMWAMPDKMAAMLEQKIEHPRAGANCAWVPSPTAATLHATHYHRVDVMAVQAGLSKVGRRAHLEALLDIPLASYRRWTPEQVRREVENNAQGILGYVVRWIDQGVGCSKVPDMNDVGLMEDRATCRISAQHIANWLHHDIISRQEVSEIMQQMAEVVDRQNADDPEYQPMAPGFDGIAYQAACDLVFEGREQPSGYTEPVLHARRLELKAQRRG